MARRDAPTSPLLTDEIRFFFTQTNPRIIAPLFLAFVALRLWYGAWTWGDVVVVAALIGMQPFVEWLIHVYVLHWKPKLLWGKKLDPLAARKHREHHRDPKQVEWIFIPMVVLFELIPALLLLYFLLLPDALALTASAAALGMLLTYEWTHYLIHSRYQPRSRVYRYVWRAHRLHHFKNEHYWFGVTMHLGDHVLGTFPAKDAVDTSPTCRNLGGEVSLTN